MPAKVTIIIPTKNEAEGLLHIIRSIKQYADEIIVVDGHSKDATKRIALQENVIYLLDHGRGRGDAVRMAIKRAHNELLVFFDADGSHEAKDIPRLLKLLTEDKADMVICSRRTGGSFDMEMNFTGLIRSMGSDILVAIVNHAYKTKLTDILYSFRAIRKSTALSLGLTADDFCIEQEMVVMCLKKGFRLLEIPSREKARAWGVSKLNTITGIKFIFHLYGKIYFS